MKRNRTAAPARGTGPRSALTAALAGTCVLGSFPTWAADQGDSESNRLQPEADLQEVVVTAEKRDSTVQKTAVSLTAITPVPTCRRRASPVSSRWHNKSPAYLSRPPAPARPSSKCAA